MRYDVFIFYSIHYPAPGREAELIESMHHYGELMNQQPGNLFVAPFPFKDPDKGTLMGISIWASEDAFKAALPAMQQHRRDTPSNDLETRPPEVFMLHSAR
jgi:hypothetical protein